MVRAQKMASTNGGIFSKEIRGPCPAHDENRGKPLAASGLTLGAKQMRIPEGKRRRSLP